jgi:hypothetical protein
VNDAIVIAIVIGFFALCTGYVIWCERVVAADAISPDGPKTSAEGRNVRDR